ncbi:MAG: type III-B CRISPR module RAMP protein Cmr4 [Infirmifilum sp.]
MAQSQNTIFSAPSVYSEHGVLLLEAVTNLHVGAGRSGGVVDLPVQRDELGFPAVYGSSLKGALKTAILWALLKRGLDKNTATMGVEALLGPEPTTEEKFESSVAVLDAYLLAMPVRSLSPAYVYVTSPRLLRRLGEYVALAGLKNESNGVLQEIINEAEDKHTSGKALCLKCKVASGSLVLTDQRVEYESSSRALKWLDLEKPVLVLDDERARVLIERGLLRVTRVRLDREKKTVAHGGLWTEEYVPSGTRFVTVVLFKRPPLSREFVQRFLKLKENGVRDAKYSPEEGGASRQNSEVGFKEYLSVLEELGIQVKENIKSLTEGQDIPKINEAIASDLKSFVLGLLSGDLRGYLILGGHETIGKGIVRVTPIY